MTPSSVSVQLDERPSLVQGERSEAAFAESFGPPNKMAGKRAGRGRKAGEPEVVFLSRLENGFSCVVKELRRILNVGLSRLDSSSPFACCSAIPPLPYGRLDWVGGECIQSFASIPNPGGKEPVICDS